MHQSHGAIWRRYQKNLRGNFTDWTSLTFETHVPERMEIISGECRVKIADSEESELFRAGQSFYVPGNSRFSIETDEVLDYVCHLEG